MVWQKTRGLINLVYDLTLKFPKNERFNLTDQLRRTAVSILANIAEGFSRYHKDETKQSYRNARGSLSEVKSLLYICSDRDYVTQKRIKDIFIIIDEVGRMLNGLIKATENYRNSRL
ncbi:four helix bundle protein [Patescibacteria group bacterium]